MLHNEIYFWRKTNAHERITPKVSYPTPQRGWIGKGKGIYFLLSATSSMPLALYNGTHTLVWTHTYTYTVKYSTHTSIHTRQPFRRRYNVFIPVTHTLTLVDVVSGPRLPDSWKSISSSEESTRRVTLDVPASIAPLTTYINSAACGSAFSHQVEKNPDLLRDRQAG